MLRSHAASGQAVCRGSVLVNAQEAALLALVGAWRSSFCGNRCLPASFMSPAAKQ